MIYRLFSIFIGYLFGNFLFGYFYCRLKNIDIRTKGSGNVGATNTIRVMGIGPGIMTLISDCIKVLLASFTVHIIFTNAGFNNQFVDLLSAYAAFGSVIGHDFPFILKGKGGKGIASSLMFTFIVLPLSLPLAVTIFILSVVIKGYVSLGSILAAIAIFIQSIIFYYYGLIFYKNTYIIEILFMISFLVVLAIYLHRKNIKRLLDGSENKFSLHKVK